MKSEKFLILTAINIALVACDPSQASTPGGIVRSSEKTLCPGIKSEEWQGYGGGDGTKSNPYLVCTNEHFKTINGDTTKKVFFKLVSDLDFASEGNLRMVALAPFATVDGGDHTIKNITIVHGFGVTGNGIFGQLTQNLNGDRDEIANLTIENVTIKGDGKEDIAGVIAGANWGGVISNVHVTGKVTVEYPDRGPGFSFVGGLVGRNSSIIENSTFSGNVVGVYNVGGIAGINDGEIRNSVASGTVQGSAGIGGVVGIQLLEGKLENNSSTSRVTGRHHFNNIVGLSCSGILYSSCDFNN